MAEPPLKRFIAGAVCPRCGCMDTLRMFRERGQQMRECVRCGYSDMLDAAGNIVEIPTRVNQARAGEKPLQHEDEIQVLTLTEGPRPGRGSV